MATSHSGWGNCPAHKKNQLAMYPGVWYIRTSVFSVIDLRCSRARSLLGGAMTFV